ncbi:MAG: integrase [Candidatus Bathyarchaeia archaeon]
MNPRPAAYESSLILWGDFEAWLRGRVSERHVRDIMRYAMRYARFLDGNLNELAGMSESKRHHIMEALSALAKFLGVYEEWRGLIKNHGLKWAINSDKLIISRLKRNPNVDEVIRWARRVKGVPGLSLFVDFVAATGLRLDEALKSWNLILERDDYYNPANSCLEHYKFDWLFIRRTKKAFISFAPAELISAIRAGGIRLTEAAIRLRIKRRGIPSRFSDLREYWATFMTRHLTLAEIDFLQGRVGTSIFMKNYFNPALIADLRDRVLRGVAEILGAINQ